MTDAERIERARRAKLAIDEFLTPAFAVVEAEYGEKMIAVAASTDPRSPEIIARLASGIKVARQVRAQIEAIVADGKVAQNEIDRAKRDEEFTAPQKRLLNIAAR